jgi:hypothetical protein
MSKLCLAGAAAARLPVLLLSIGVAAGCGDNLAGPGTERDAGTNLPGDNPGPSAGITVAPTSGLTTTEAGGETTFSVVLDAEPTSDVTIALSSTDPGEGTVSPATLSFTPVNWNAPRTVTVKGVDDDMADGDANYMIVSAPASSSDDRYHELDAANVSVTNDDDETPGITVTGPDGGFTTSEGGASDTLTIVLDSEPSADVTIGTTSSDPGEGVLEVDSVTFTPLNWASPQAITITGVDDDEDDGDQPYQITTGAATSADAGYDGIKPVDVDGINIDDDVPGATIVPGAEPLTTGENGDFATFTITLNSQPTGDVTIALTSSDEGEGTVEPTTIVFTPVNWNSLVEVTVTGVDDDQADLDQPYSISFSVTSAEDAGYDGLVIPDVDLVNIDDDSPGITVNPLSGLTTTEGGGTATFTITLNSQPTDDVTITLFSENEEEGTVSPTLIVFTPISWNALVEVTVTGVDDDVADGNATYFINIQPATSNDPGYNGLDAPNVSVSNIDNDIPDVIVTPTGGLVTSEFLEEAEFSIVLATQPSANVTILLESDDLTEGTIDTASVTFTPGNWNVPQIVIITGVDDPDIDGNQPYSIITSATASDDPDYAGLPVADVEVVNIDDESPHLVIQPRRKLHFTNEQGTVSTTLQIRLSVAPTSDVTCTFEVSDPTEGSLSTGTFVFTAANWDVRQDLIVFGEDDDIDDGDQRFFVITNPCTSADLAYSGFNAPNMAVLNRDDE